MPERITQEVRRFTGRTGHFRSRSKAGVAAAHALNQVDLNKPDLAEYNGVLRQQIWGVIGSRPGGPEPNRQRAPVSALNPSCRA
jgi:hypothetical protein